LNQKSKKYNQEPKKHKSTPNFKNWEAKFWWQFISWMWNSTWLCKDSTNK